MDLKNQNGADVQGNGSAKAGLNNASQNNDAKKGAVAESNAKTNGKADPGKEKETGNGTQEAVAKNEPAKPETPQQQKEEAKPVKVALNLEGTLKLVDELHRRSIQRVNLISRIKQLEVFEVNLTAENDELEENPYQGCKLIIEDDKGRRFITTTPGLIRLVAQFIFNACNEKLADIEAHIVLPNA